MRRRYCPTTSQPRVRQCVRRRIFADGPGPVHHRGAENQPAGGRSPQRAPGGDTFRIRPDITQEEHVEGLPMGTRGGTLIPYTFPRDGQYEVQVRLTRDRNETVEGLHEPHELEVLLDRERREVVHGRASNGARITKKWTRT